MRAGQGGRLRRRDRRASEKPHRDRCPRPSVRIRHGDGAQHLLGTRRENKAHAEPAEAQRRQGMSSTAAERTLLSSFLDCQWIRPKTATPVVVPTNTLPFATTGVMNLLSVKLSRLPAAWLLL